MNPIKDVYQALAMPLKAVFVVGLCWIINAATFTGTWWVKWVALGMGIATVMALARGIRTLLVLALVWWAGRKIYDRYGPAMRERFDAWVARTQPKASEVFDALRPNGPVMANADGSPLRH